MFIQIIEILFRYYYQFSKIINAMSPIEIEIKRIDQYKIGYKYYYYILNYYLNDSLDYILKSFCRYNSYYKQINYYEVTYRYENMERTTIINGSIKDIFNYTRFNKDQDKLIILMKCNLIINNNSNNIRQLIRKYNTKTKLYDIIYFNYLNNILNTEIIELEIGKNKYNLYDMNRNLLLEDA